MLILASALSNSLAKLLILETRKSLRLQACAHLGQDRLTQLAHVASTNVLVSCTLKQLLPGGHELLRHVVKRPCCLQEPHGLDSLLLWQVCGHEAGSQEVTAPRLLQDHSKPAAVRLPFALFACKARSLAAATLLDQKSRSAEERRRIFGQVVIQPWLRFGTRRFKHALTH